MNKKLLEIVIYTCIVFGLGHNYFNMVFFYLILSIPPLPAILCNNDLFIYLFIIIIIIISLFFSPFFFF